MRHPWLYTLLVMTACGAATAADVVLVKEGQPQAQIVVADGASDQVKQAAKTLSDYLRDASGPALPVIEEAALAAEAPGQLVFVGQTQRWPVPFPQGFDHDGFVILARGRAVSICGPTDWGTEFGVYEFLERYVGVRWLMPGENGTDIPLRPTLSVPEGRVQDQPVFFSRLLSGLYSGAAQQWARFNRMHGRVSFHHNLLRVFPWKQYAESHPEFYPMCPPSWRGHDFVNEPAVRYLPHADDDENWQPCLTAAGSVDEAAKNIIRFFDEHPQETSFSLGMNDSGRFCLCDNCRARISGDKNYLGWINYSELYYDWCNQVIERVLKVHPDKWFGCLAYFNVATPPQTVKVNPRLVPYITYDRMTWLDPKRREAGHQATREWQASVPSFAWYDYIYGTPYCLPRIYVHHAGEYLRYGADHGVKAHYAEIYANFGEGPKPYLHLKLWWNPRRDVDAMLQEWYQCCVGPEAAPFLAQYYAIWERFWTKDILTSAWFKDAGTWLPFSDPGYLGSVKLADITRSRKLLEDTIAHTKTDQQRARAELLEKAFQYYEACAISYLASRDLPPAPKTEAEAVALLDRSMQAMAMAHKRRHLITHVYPNDPVLLHPLSIDTYLTPSATTWGGNVLWQMADWVRRGDNAVRRRIEQLAQGAEDEAVRNQAGLLLRIVDGKNTLVSRNPSFEEGEGEGSVEWTYWLKPDEPPLTPLGRMLRSQDVAHTGTYSLLAEGLQRGAPVQTIETPGPGKYAAIAWVYVPEGQPRMGSLQFVITPLDEAGRNLPGFETTVERSAGAWALGVLGFDLPESLEGRRIKHLRLLPIVNGHDEKGGKVYWDDVGLYRIE
jgi:hypothetical protein